MIDPLLQEGVALAAFLGLHLVLTLNPIRDRLMSVMGEKAYTGAFSLVAATSLGWAVFAFSEADYVEFWVAPYGWRYVAMAINALAFVLVAAAMMTPNPTVVGMEGKVDLAPVGILHVTRHPLMWGIALMSASHMVANGNLAALMLFGTLAVLAIAGSLHQERRKAAARGTEWEAFVARTSYVPFGALLQGRTKVSLRDVGYGRIAVGLVLFAVIFWFHADLFGYDLVEALDFS